MKRRREEFTLVDYLLDFILAAFLLGIWFVVLCLVVAWLSPGNE